MKEQVLHRQGTSASTLILKEVHASMHAVVCCPSLTTVSRCHEAEEEAQDGLTPMQYSIDIIIWETMIDLLRLVQSG